MAMNLSLQNTTSTYHIYLRGECLFKDLDSYEFNLIWGRIYKSYFRDELTYEEIEFDTDITEDASY
jgi:hypothetical protein|tara:strand:- start:712 stop:909 length:198 start_codon:yes stop_codon:yes gene_type:complete